jgi:hypothetical protein
MNGKGDTPRPSNLNAAEFAARWAQTFGTRHETHTVPCDVCKETKILADGRVCYSCRGQGHV